jgi:hypothetical protein
MEKDRGRRYSSAAEFAGDIGRYLNNEPVVARSRSPGYWLRKFVRRNRVVGVATTFFAILIVGILAILLTIFGSLHETAGEVAAESRLEVSRLARRVIERLQERAPGTSVEQLYEIISPDAGMHSELVDTMVFSRYIVEIDIVNPAGRILSSSTPNRVGSTRRYLKNIAILLRLPAPSLLRELFSKGDDYQEYDQMESAMGPGPGPHLLILVQAVISRVFLRDALLKKLVRWLIPAFLAVGLVVSGMILALAKLSK